MSDKELVKRLRKTTQSGKPTQVSKADRLAAADRIEELEAKLAKAVAILRDAERLCADGHPVSALNLALAILAELKGEDQG